MVLKNKIFVFDDVLSSEDCYELIEYYKNSKQQKQWRDTFPLDLDINVALIHNTIFKIQYCITQLGYNIFPDWCQIVKWNTDTYQDLHHDTANKSTIFTSITYLNDEYMGGETFFSDGTLIKPKGGRTLFFDGQYHLHGVKNILHGTRFTLPIWYKGIE
jgi:hypothetical protein